MNYTAFEEFLDERLTKCRDVMAVKNQEYARGDDKFNNFKKASKMLGCTPERALLGFLMKQFISVVDFIGDLEKGTGQPYAMWEEKIGDTINYLILLQGLVKERNLKEAA